MKHLKTFEQYQNDEVTQEGIKDFTKKAVIGSAMAASLLGTPSKAHGQVGSKIKDFVKTGVDVIKDRFAKPEETGEVVEFGKKPSKETYEEFLSRVKEEYGQDKSYGVGVAKSSDINHCERMAEMKAMTDVLNKMGKSKGTLKGSNIIEQKKFYDGNNYVSVVVIRVDKTT